ncbi:DDE_3 domain-containing protein [Trichonephila clavipes]|nr:DDE_3 domain-containing protein [Trichonephila clavipes]
MIRADVGVAIVLFWGEVITAYGCGGALVSGTIPTHSVLRHTAHTAGVMVWGAIAYDNRSFLIVMRGTLTDQRYFDDILQPHLGPFLNGLPGAIFIQDNAHPHTDQLNRQMPSCHSVHDLELVVQDLSAHLPQGNIMCLINSMPDRVVACIAAGGGPTRS